MCAPRKLLPIIAIAGLAVATGGLSVGATTAATTSTTAATTAATTASTTANFGTAFHATQQATTLQSLATALQTGLKFANTAAPLIGAGGLVYRADSKSILEQQAAYLTFSLHKKKKLMH